MCTYVEGASTKVTKSSETKAPAAKPVKSLFGDASGGKPKVAAKKEEVAAATAPPADEDEEDDEEVVVAPTKVEVKKKRKGIVDSDDEGEFDDGSDVKAKKTRYVCASLT
jgi:hypothetical protein